jgi:hypothetical protein
MLQWDTTLLEVSEYSTLAQPALILVRHLSLPYANPVVHTNHPHVAHNNKRFPPLSGSHNAHRPLLSPLPGPTPLTSLGQGSTSIGNGNEWLKPGLVRPECIHKITDMSDDGHYNAPLLCSAYMADF